MQNHKFEMFFQFTQNWLNKKFLVFSYLVCHMPLFMLEILAQVISMFHIYHRNFKCDLQDHYTLINFKLSTIFCGNFILIQQSKVKWPLKNVLCGQWKLEGNTLNCTENEYNEISLRQTLLGPAPHVVESLIESASDNKIK